MPKSADEEHDHRVDAGAQQAFAAAAQREIDIAREKPRERDVPTLPKFLYIARAQRREEIVGNLDVEH